MMVTLSYIALALVVIGAAAVGAASGLLAVRWMLARQEDFSNAGQEPVDEFTAAAIDQAAVQYATDQGRPETAGIIADKLHMLHRLEERRRWQS
jgi:hypothetical protein